MKKILIVDDEPTLIATLKYNLERENYQVATASDGEGALSEARNGSPDLIVLDLMLPRVSGLEVCRILRKETSVPILMLTAKDAEIDKVVGLEVGADDYVTKPFSVSELLARVAVHLRRTSIAAAPNDGIVHRFGDIEVRPAARTVSLRGEAVSLKPREYDLLLKFIARPGIVFTRQKLLREVWEHQADVLTRTVDIHVGELRRKLEADPAHPRHFITVWKTGYRFDP